MAKPNLKTLVAHAQNWNAKYPIGTQVIRYRLVNPLRDPEPTATRSYAWVMGGHSVVVLVDGVAGGVLLESIVPLEWVYRTPPAALEA